MVAIRVGKETMNVDPFTQDELDVFNKEFPELISMYTKYSGNQQDGHAIMDVLWNMKQSILEFGMLCKREIEPAAGEFEGMNPKSGFGFTLIRPDYLFDSTQGRTWDQAVSGLTANNWYTLYSTTAIGGAYTASTNLYLRKELGVCIAGHLELANPLIEEVRWEIDGDIQLVLNMLPQMRATDLKLYAYNELLQLRPSKQFGAQAKFAAVAGNVCPMALGVAFVNKDYMKNTAPTQPAETAP